LYPLEFWHLQFINYKEYEGTQSENTGKFFSVNLINGETVT